MRSTTLFTTLIFKVLILLGCILIFVLPSSKAGAAIDSKSLEISEGLQESKEPTITLGPNFRQKLQSQIQSFFPGAKIELVSPVLWVQTRKDATLDDFNVLSVDSKGIAFIDATFKQEDHRFQTKGRVEFSAWKTAHVALRRVPPRQKLNAKDFKLQKVNVAHGRAHEYRGILADDSVVVSQLESLSTILEGNYLLTNAVRRVPNVRRGEVVRVRLMSGNLTVDTQGTVTRAAYTDDVVEVFASKTKKVVSGTLRKDGTVEVQI